MTETQKRKKRMFHRKFARSISKYPACEHLNMALWYLRAFARMIKVREETGKDNLHPRDWSAPEKVMAWWLQGQKKEEPT